MTDITHGIEGLINGYTRQYGKLPKYIYVGQQQVEELIVQLELPYNKDTYDVFYGGDSVISWMDLEVIPVYRKNYLNVSF